MRGAQLFLGACGALNTSAWFPACGTRRLGVFEISLSVCRFSPMGVVVYS